MAWCAPDYSESLDALEIAFHLALRDMERPSRCLWCTIVAGLQNPREGKGGTWFTMLQHPGQKVTSITWPSLDVVLTRRVRPLGRGAYVEVSASTAEGVALASAMLSQLRTLGQPVPPTGHRGDCPGEPVGEPGRPGLDRDELVYRLSAALRARELRAGGMTWAEAARELRWRYGHGAAGVKLLQDAEKRLCRLERSDPEGLLAELEHI